MEDRYRKVCLQVGNANTKVYQILRDAEPLHFYEIVMRSSLSRSTVYEALIMLESSGLVQKDEKNDTWRAV